MNMNKIRAFLCAVLAVAAMAAQGQPAAPGVAALSAWTNQSGSTLYIDSIDTSGKLTGHYINRAAGYGCQNIAYPVTGWVYGTAITFTTLWQSSTVSCNSITAWTGFLYQGQINTQWQLVVNGSTSPQQILKGSDLFTQTARTTLQSLMPQK